MKHGLNTDFVAERRWKLASYAVTGDAFARFVRPERTAERELPQLAAGGMTKDGWMIFDADSISNDCSCAPSGWLQSPAYNCSGHLTVRLNFEEYFGNVQDTTQVWVSTDPTFATYTVYPIHLNDAVPFASTTANVATIHLNISATAAGHPRDLFLVLRFLGGGGG